MSNLDRRPDDIDELLGAYALDAVDDDERRIVEGYLENNPRARAEVDQHREVATLLAFGGADAPEGLWDQIASSLEERGQEAPEPGPELAKVLPARRPPQRSRRWLGGLAAAAVVVLVAALSIALVNRDNGGSSQSGSIVAAFDAAKSDPASTTVQLASPDGTTRATAVVEPSGRAFLDPTALPTLAADRTYQLWGVLADGTPVSLGVLGADPQLTIFGVNGPVSVLAITDEKAGGVVAPEKPAEIVGQLA